MFPQCIGTDEDNMRETIFGTNVLNSDDVSLSNKQANIRSTFKLSSNIWNPARKYLIGKLDNIQRRFTKRVPTGH